MTGPALAASAVALVGVGSVLLLVLGLARMAGRVDELERQADWCEDGFVEHLHQECRHAHPVALAAPRGPFEVVEAAAAADERARTLADVDLALTVTQDLLVVWPGDPWVTQWRDQLLDERSALTRSPWPPPAAQPSASPSTRSPSGPSPRVVRRAARST